MTAAGGLGQATVHPVTATMRRLSVNLVGAIAMLRLPPRVPGTRRRMRAGRLMAGTLLAIALCGAAMLLLDRWEIWFYHLLPRWALVVFSEITDFGKSHWFLVPTGLALIAAAAVLSPALGRTAHLVLLSVTVRIGFVFLAIGLPSLAVTIGKRLIGRARPPLFNQTGPFDFVPFSWRVEYASMPSGHATSAFAAAVAIGALFPRARTAMWVYAGIIALSRVALAAHYPSDVIAGALVGAAGALLVRWWFATRRLGFTVGTDGAVRALPGPSLGRLKRVARRVLGQ